jgi:hypothetical protein
MEPEEITNTLKTDKAFAGRAGVQMCYRRGLPKLCQVTRFLGQCQVSPGFNRSGACAVESGGRKKSPQALMAWWAKAGDNFFEIFFGFVFSIDWEKMNIHLLMAPHQRFQRSGIE